MMLIMFAELLVMPSFEYWCAVKRYNYEAKGVVVASAIIAVATPIVIIPLILHSNQKGLTAIIGKNSVAIVVYLTIAVGMLKKNRHLYNKEFWKYALNFNLPLVPHFLSIILLQSSDRIMIERMCGATDAAIYSVAYQAASSLSIFNAAVLNTFIPYTYRAMKDGKEENISKRSIPLVIFIGFINFVVALCAPEIIKILAPSKYQIAIYVIPPVTISNLLMFLFNLFANIEYYFKETKLVALASIISAIVNLVLNYIFIQSYGFIAAGYTTLVCYILFSFCHYIFMRKVLIKYMDGKKIYDARILAVIVIVFTVGAVLITQLYEKQFMIIRYVLLVLMLIVGWLKREQIKSLSWN